MLLILECKADERLAMSLNVPRKRIRHQNDKGEVCNFLRKHKGNIGLVDEDPNSTQPKYLVNTKSISNKFGIKELTDVSGGTILVICPRLEDWIIQACHQSQIDITAYSLPDDPKQLHKEINYKLEKFDELLARLLDNKNSSLLQLKSFLN